MAIMKCPRCGGCGEIWMNYGEQTAAAPHKTLCPSCGGRGYVTDKEEPPCPKINTSSTSV